MSERYEQLLRLINAVGVAPGIGSIGQGWALEQSPVELAHFLEACEQFGVKSMLELGVGENGGISRLAYRYLGWSVTSIDHRRPTVEVGRFILGETGDPDVFAQVKNERFDLVFIDACHAYDDVKRDTDWYAPLADKIIAWHDVAEGREGTQGSVMVWDTTPEPKVSIIDPNHPIGIGYCEVASQVREHE